MSTTLAGLLSSGAKQVKYGLEKLRLTPTYMWEQNNVKREYTVEAFQTLENDRIQILKQIQDFETTINTKKSNTETKIFAQNSDVLSEFNTLFQKLFTFWESHKTTYPDLLRDICMAFIQFQIDSVDKTNTKADTLAALETFKASGDFETKIKAICTDVATKLIEMVAPQRFTLRSIEFTQATIDVIKQGRSTFTYPTDLADAKGQLKVGISDSTFNEVVDAIDNPNGIVCIYSILDYITPNTYKIADSDTLNLTLPGQYSKSQLKTKGIPDAVTLLFSEWFRLVGVMLAIDYAMAAAVLENLVRTFTDVRFWFNPLPDKKDIITQRALQSGDSNGVGFSLRNLLNKKELSLLFVFDTPQKAEAMSTLKFYKKLGVTSNQITINLILRQGENIESARTILDTFQEYGDTRDLFVYGSGDGNAPSGKFYQQLVNTENVLKDKPLPRIFLEARLGRQLVNYREVGYSTGEIYRQIKYNQELQNQLNTKLNTLLETNVEPVDAVKANGFVDKFIEKDARSFFDLNFSRDERKIQTPLVMLYWIRGANFLESRTFQINEKGGVNTKLPKEGKPWHHATRQLMFTIKKIGEALCRELDIPFYFVPIGDIPKMEYQRLFYYFSFTPAVFSKLQSKLYKEEDKKFKDILKNFSQGEGSLRYPTFEVMIDSLKKFGRFKGNQKLTTYLENFRNTIYDLSSIDLAGDVDTYVVSDKIIKYLESEGVPQDIIEILKKPPIYGKVYKKQKDFDAALKSLIVDQRVYKKHRINIIKYAAIHKSSDEEPKPYDLVQFFTNEPFNNRNRFNQLYMFNRLLKRQDIHIMQVGLRSGAIEQGMYLGMPTVYIDIDPESVRQIKNESDTTERMLKMTQARGGFRSFQALFSQNAIGAYPRLTDDTIINLISQVVKHSLKQAEPALESQLNSEITQLNEKQKALTTEYDRDPRDNTLINQLEEQIDGLKKSITKKKMDINDAFTKSVEQLVASDVRTLLKTSFIKGTLNAYEIKEMFKILKKLYTLSVTKSAAA